jgi:hypothetical protein
MRVAARAATFFTTVAFQSQKQRVALERATLANQLLELVAGVRFELLDDLWPRVPRFLWARRKESARLFGLITPQERKRPDGASGLS